MSPQSREPSWSTLPPVVRPPARSERPRTVVVERAEPEEPRATTARGRLGWVVTASFATAFAAVVVLVAAPFVAVTESAITGAVLCGVAVGWATLLGLSRRRIDRFQDWAAVPALFTGLGGLLVLTFGAPMRQELSWMWPPMLLVLVAWTAVQVRRDLPSRGGRVQLYAVLAVLALCAVGGGWQTVSEVRETNPYLTSGRLVDVGGHALRLECHGAGSPTVVLEPGAGGTSASTAWIAPAVADRTRVCVYDRAGRGGSEPADGPQDGARVAADLHTLLRRGGVAGPYVLAGHSFGGLYVRIFAARYPEEVAGLVLVDSTAARLPARSVLPAGQGRYDGIGRVATLVSLSARRGLTRLFGDLVEGTLPAGAEARLRYDAAQATTVRSVVEEYGRGGATAQEAASLQTFGDKPLYVLTAGQHPASWMAAQRAMATLSTDAVHRVVQGATHQALVDEPQYAARVSGAVLDVVTAVRDNRPLHQ